MNRIEYRLLAGLVAAAIGCTHIGAAAAAGTANQAPTQPTRPEAKAPFLGRVVVRPTPVQRAQLERERRRVTGSGNRARAGAQASRGHAATIGAL
ncbi:MAG: hypothetical protein ACYC7B_07510 [Burkholderiales bacterium]